MAKAAIPPIELIVQRFRLIAPGDASVVPPMTTLTGVFRSRPRNPIYRSKVEAQLLRSTSGINGPNDQALPGAAQPASPQVSAILSAAWVALSGRSPGAVNYLEPAISRAE
jgi:hypothetical protein